MSIPEGYASAPTAFDHLVKIAVPVSGRDPILIEAPKLAWISPEEVEAYSKWMEPFMEAEKSVLDWRAANKDKPESEREPFPSEAEKKVEGLLLRETKIRWLKPYLSAADYKTLVTSKKIAEATIDWIVGQLKASDPIDPISVGESSASDDS